MSKLLLFPCILFVLLLSCTKSSEEKLVKKYFDLTWSTKDGVFFKNGGTHSPTYLDTTTHELVGDTIIPFRIAGDYVIVEWLAAADIKPIDDRIEFKWGVVKDTLRTDTLLYELKNFHGPKLLLYWSDSVLLHVLKTDDIAEIIPINPRSSIEFEISGYSLGDRLDLASVDLQESEVDDDLGVLVETYSLKEDEDIEFSAIGGDIISGIVRKNITQDQLPGVIEVISQKTQEKPVEFSNEHGYATVRNMFWLHDEISINLIKIDWKNRLYFESEATWDLHYSSESIERMLAISYMDEVPKSSIIQ